MVHFRMPRPVLPCVTLLCAVLAAPARGQSPDLTGHWVLKAEEAAADSAARAADTVQVAGDSADVSGPPSDLHPVLRRRGRPEDRQQLSRLIGMAQPVAGFRIVQTDTAVRFTNDDGFSYTVRPGADWDSIAAGDQSIRVRSRWRGDALEVEFRPPGGGKIVETYHLADSRTYLRVEVVVEHDVLAQRLWRPRMYRLSE